MSRFGTYLVHISRRSALCRGRSLEMLSRCRSVLSGGVEMPYQIPCCGTASSCTAVEGKGTQNMEMLIGRKMD